MTAAVGGVMFRSMRQPILASMIVLGVMVSPCSVGARRQTPAPWLGTWTLDPAESTPRPGPAEYARVTFKIEPWKDGLRVSYDMVGNRGGRTHLEWTGAFDGADYPVQGVDYVLTNAYRQIDADSYELRVKLDGRQVATTQVSVSDDGRVLTALTREVNGAGETVTTRAVYHKEGG